MKLFHWILKSSMFSIGALAIILLVFTQNLSAQSKTAEAKNLPEIQIKLPAPCAETHPSCGFALVAKKWIEEITGGRAKVTVYWSNSLVPLKDHYRALQVGIADFAFVNTGLPPGVFPLTELFHLPGIAPKISAANLALFDLFQKYPQFEQQFNPKVKYIATCQFLLSDLHTTKPVRRLEDLKGMKIGCQTAESARALEKLGASVSTIPWTDMYMQLERGVVDGVVAAWAIVNITKLHEIAKYHTSLRITPALAHWMFNRATWDKFTPEEQEKFELLSVWVTNATHRGVATTSQMMRFREITPEKGHVTIEFPPEDWVEIKKLYRPFWDEWALKMERLGHPGKAILEDALNLNEMYSYE